MSYMTMGDEIHALRTDRASLVAERDAAIDECRRAKATLLSEKAALRVERDALVAHVARLTGDLHHLIAHSEGVAGLHLNGDVAPWGELTRGGHYEAWLRSLDEKPETSLARLKAQWQAEALDDVINEAEYAGWETAPLLLLHAMKHQRDA